MRFKDKIVLITGASVGIGHSAALMFAREGARLVINSQSSRGQTVAEEITIGGGQAIFVQGSVEEPADAQRMVEAAVAEFGRLDILVNNAGIVLPGTVDNMSVEDWDRTIAVDVRGVFLMSKFAVQQMLHQGGGVIIHNGSIAAVTGLKDRAASTILTRRSASIVSIPAQP